MLPSDGICSCLQRAWRRLMPWCSCRRLTVVSAGLAMDRFRRIPVIATGFILGKAGMVCAAVGAHSLSSATTVVGFVPNGSSTSTEIVSRTAAADMCHSQYRECGIRYVHMAARFLLGSLLPLNVCPDPSRMGAPSGPYPPSPVLQPRRSCSSGRKNPLPSVELLWRYLK